MIARWMVAAIVFGALTALAALALEHARRATRRALRWPWVMALVIAVVWPLAAPVLLTPRATTLPLVTTSVIGAATAAVDIANASSTPWIERVDIALAVLWAAATTALLTQIVLAMRTLARVGRRATAANLDGEAVLLDGELGPAVIGFRQPRIVVPMWLLDIDTSLRTLVLRHEREHCRAGDLWLVWLSVAGTTLMPWNPAVWWIARHLRAAMEIDCDARTLRGDVDRTRYASLLLLIAQRHASARFAPLLSPGASQLTRRISAMHASPLRFRVLHVASAVSLAVMAIAVACSPRVITNLTSPAPMPASAPTSAEASAPATVATQPSGTSTVRPAVAVNPATQAGVREAAMMPGNRPPTYPPELRAAGVSATVVMQFVVNADGSVDTNTVKVLRATVSSPSSDDDGRAFARAVRDVLPTMRYTAARVGGRNVRQLVTLPFAFSLVSGSAAMSPGAPTDPARARPSAPPTNIGDNPYFDFQVEQPVKLRAGQAGPRYPEALRAAKIEGMVLAQFVVDTAGTVDMRTYKVLKSDNDAFSGAVREALTEMRFEPALVGGRPVKQLMQTPFQFRVPKE